MPRFLGGYCACQTGAALPFEDDYAAASAVNFKVTGKKLPKQSFGIMPKIAEVDSLVTPDRQSRVREVHPEVCFWALNDGRPMRWNKKTQEGSRERWDALRKVLPSLAPEPATLKGCALDDYIDALAAAWTAVCLARGSATRIPERPSLDAKGLRMEMWMPTA